MRWVSDPMETVVKSALGTGIGFGGYGWLTSLELVGPALRVEECSKRRMPEGGAASLLPAVVLFLRSFLAVASST